MVGIEFGVVTTHFSGIAHLSEIGFLQNGASGVWAEYRDYDSGGLSFTPASQELSVASFAYQEAQLGRVAANASIRFDTKTANPDEESVSPRVGFIRQRLGEFENPRLDENLNPVYDDSGSLVQIPTESFVAFDLSAQYYFVTGRFLHTLTLSVENAGNTENRKHLNRVKEIMPEPGRNFKLLYKVYF